MQPGKYEVLGVVGEGAYGIVYKCKNKETGDFVAIKKFKETNDDLVKKTMKRELRMLQQLTHENIVQFKEAFKRKGNLFLVFEYVEKNLLEVLQDHPKGLEPKLIRNLMFQLCKSIKYLHERNVIHRDIKPENLLVNENMVLKVCDFGFARTIASTPKEKLTDYVATRWYRAPELLLTQGVYGPEVDYWAIGCIMGELVDGNPLFPGENEVDQLHCIQKVLGNFTDEQVEMFYTNPLFNGKDLINVSKPETLERRYYGKLPKLAINFMKGLLQLDPKMRLNSNTVFQHPYFEKLIEKENGVRIFSQRGTTSENPNKVYVNMARRNNSNNTNSVNNPQQGQQPKENSTSITNINIINYNNYGDGYYQMEQNNQQKTNKDNFKEKENKRDQQQKDSSKEQGREMSKEKNREFSKEQKESQKEQNENIYSLANPGYSKQFPTHRKEENILCTSNPTQAPSGQIALENVYKTFYKNKEKDLYNIEIDIQNMNINSNPNNNQNGPQKKNYLHNSKHVNKYQNQSLEDEMKYQQHQNDKKKQKFMNQIYKPNSKIYENHSNQNLYYKNSSPKSTYYNQKYVSKNNLHLPVIPKGTIYNLNYNNRKYNYY